MTEDETLREFLKNSASSMEGLSDEPTIISLNDTVEVLKKKNPDWLNDRFSRSIFAWQSGLFLEDHVREVCAEHCPDLLETCLEYRNKHTIMGLPISNLFGVEALNYIMPKHLYPNQEERFGCAPVGCAPVRNCYFKFEEK